MNNNFRILAEKEFINNNTWKTGINNNDLIIGPSGAGKTRNYVKPNIMQCNESMIIADTKGNLHKQLGALLEEKGYEVMVVDFKDISKSYGYNPFDFIRYDEQRKRYSEQDILTISQTLVPCQNSKEPFWDMAAKMYLSCLISYVVECLPEEEHNLESVIELLSIINTQIFTNLIDLREIENPKSFAVRQFKLFSGNKTAEKMNQSIIGILSEHLNILTFDDALELYKSPNRINFNSISTKKTALFLTISDTDRSMDKLSSLLYTQALQSLCNIADDSEDGRLKVPVRFIFDDFATNTIIKDFDNIISVIRSREIYVSIILQSITQLYSIYGEEKAKTIINNCDNCLYLGGQDIDTANYISTKSNMPIEKILNMPLNNAYLFTRGTLPKKVEKFDITRHQEYLNLPEGKKGATKNEDEIER